MAVHAALGKHSEWYTPSIYIEAARRVMGSIDFDPASSEKANETVRAYSYNTRDRNDAWYGNVWMNPPYSDYSGQGAKWVQTLAESFARGEVNQAMILINQSILYQYGPQQAMKLGAVCLVDHRIAYIDGRTMEPQKSPPQANAFIYLTKYTASYEAFADIFGEFGAVMQPLQRSRGLDK